MVQQTSQSTFEELCQMYPCRNPSSQDDPQKQSCDDGDIGKSCHVDVAEKIHGLRTADIVKILLQPAVLDTIVAELENGFL